MEHTVEITMSTWLSLLEDRREVISPRGWTIPDCVWNYAVEILEDCGPSSDPAKNAPSYLVDNLAVNGDYGSFDDYRNTGESDEELIARVKNRALVIFPEEKIIVYSL